MGFLKVDRIRRDPMNSRKSLIILLALAVTLLAGCTNPSPEKASKETGWEVVIVCTTLSSAGFQI